MHIYLMTAIETIEQAEWYDKDTNCIPRNWHSIRHENCDQFFNMYIPALKPEKIRPVIHHFYIREVERAGIVPCLNNLYRIPIN